MKRWPTSIGVQKALKWNVGVSCSEHNQDGRLDHLFFDHSALISVFRTAAMMCADILFVQHLKFALIAIETTEKRMMRKKDN
jgi:hypothetical protein